MRQLSYVVTIETSKYLMSVPGHKMWATLVSGQVEQKEEYAAGSREAHVKGSGSCRGCHTQPAQAMLVAVLRCQKGLSASAACRQSAGAQRTSCRRSSSRRGPPAPGRPASALRRQVTVSHSSRAAPGPAQPCQSLQAARCRPLACLQSSSCRNPSKHPAAGAGGLKMRVFLRWEQRGTSTPQDVGTHGLSGACSCRAAGSPWPHRSLLSCCCRRGRLHGCGCSAVAGGAALAGAGCWLQGQLSRLGCSCGACSLELPAAAASRSLDSLCKHPPQ